MPEDFRRRVQRADEVAKDSRFLRVLANAPHLCSFYYDEFYDKVFFSGCADVRMKELLRLRLAGLHGCMYCQKSDTMSAMQNGVSQDEIDALWSSRMECFSAAEQAMIAFADEISMAKPEGSVSPELMTQLRTHFGDDEILEFGLVAAVLSGMAKLLFVLGLVDREVVCVIPEGST